jgi:hypothetical protein
MGRLTQMIAYLNSTKEDWFNSPAKISYTDFTHFNIDETAKKAKKMYKKINKANELGKF